MRQRLLVRRALLATVVLALVSGGVGATVAAFTGSTANPASSFAASATFPPVWVQELGSNTCGGTSSVVTVPAGGVPAGHTLIAQVVLRGGSYQNAVSVTDSRGNTYAVDRDVTRTTNTIRTVVFSAYVATPLQAGDTITATHGDSASEGLAVDQVRRLPSTGAQVASNAANGSSTTPSVTVTTTAGDRLIYGAVGLASNASISTEAANFQLAHDLYQNCGGPSNRARNHAAYRIVSTGTSFTYDPQLSASTGWVNAGIAYTG